MLLTVFSIGFSGCAHIKRPDTDLCIANAPKKVRKCYNMARDYTDDGRLKKDAKPFYKPLNSIDDINKNLTVDSEKSLPNLKAYLQDLRDEYARRNSMLEEEPLPPLVDDAVRDPEDDELFQLPPGGLL